MATYDKMSTAEQLQLFEVLGALTGLQEGPTGRFSDGSYFEYDRTVGKTVEVTPSGQRFAVVLKGENLQRDSPNAVVRKGEAG